MGPTPVRAVVALRSAPVAVPSDRVGAQSVGPTAPVALGPDDRERFRQLVLPHLQAAYSFACFLCRDPGLAEDLAQDAFLRALRGFHGFRDGDPKAWLLTIVRSSHLTWARSRGARLHAVLDDVENMPTGEDTPEEALVRQGVVETVRGAISSLPEPFRETLVRRELEEMSYREIAQVTSAPIGTVMSRLARGRQMLLAALGAGRPEAETWPAMILSTTRRIAQQ